jgi:hypothetical protein
MKAMEIEKTRDLSRNEELEARISHWERHLSNSLHAVYVAQQELQKLYPQRYEIVLQELGHTAFTERTMQESEVTDKAA